MPLTAAPATNQPMSANQLIFTQSMRETRSALIEWNQHPTKVLRQWLLVAVSVALGLLFAVFVVGSVVRPAGAVSLPTFDQPPALADAMRVFGRNVLVLALHGFICIAAFMAMRAIPQQVEARSGIDRWVHQNAARFAMVWIAAATLFSVSSQVYVLGHSVANLSLEYGISTAQLMVTVLPHAVIELTAMFLPLAAFFIASRTGKWNELLAATAATVAIAIPMLVIAAMIEAYAWPILLRAVVL